MDPTTDLNELLRRLQKATDDQIGFKPRKDEEKGKWKDPERCMKRLGILRSDAVTILKHLKPSDCYKEPERAYDERHPSPKFFFRTREPQELTNGVRLFIKLSSPDSVFVVYVDSFHEAKRPSGCTDDED